MYLKRLCLIYYVAHILFVHLLCGKQVRIMKGKDSSENKGYAFVTFRSKDLATKAIKDLNNTEFKVFLSLFLP